MGWFDAILRASKTSSSYTRTLLAHFSLLCPDITSNKVQDPKNISYTYISGDWHILPTGVAGNDILSTEREISREWRPSSLGADGSPGTWPLLNEHLRALLAAGARLESVTQTTEEATHIRSATLSRWYENELKVNQNKLEPFARSPPTDVTLDLWRAVENLWLGDERLWNE